MRLRFIETPGYPHAAAVIGHRSMATVGARVAGCLLLALRTLLISPQTGASQPRTATPTWLSTITPLVNRGSLGLRPVTLFYEVSRSKWLQAGSIQMAFTSAPGLVEATTSAKSTGLVRAIWPYDSRTTTHISTKSLLPYRFEHVQTEHGVKAEYEATYRNRRMTIESTITPKDGKGVQHHERSFVLDEIRDVHAALLYLQQAELRSNDRVALLVQPLDGLYLVSFDVAGREPRKILGQKWKTFKLDVQICRVSDNLELEPYSKMRHATIWLSDDDYRVPVEIEADIFIGFISVRLVGRSSP